MKTKVLMIVAALLGATAAHAQQMPAPSGMSESPCPPADAGPPAAMLAMMLQPGAKPPSLPPAGKTDPGLQDYMRRHAEGLLRDYGDLCRYKAANAALKQPPRVVLIGDSITDNWLRGDPSLFSDQVVDRGIGGQTSPQMLVRFYQDVVSLRPRAVHIMAGTNDVAGNTGPSSPDDFKNNVRAMVDLAEKNGVRVILAAIPPADRFPFQADIHPQAQIAELNRWLRDFARERRLTFVDYGPVLATPAGGMKPELSNDGVHPTIRGYAVMRPLFERAVEDALR